MSKSHKTVSSSATTKTKTKSPSAKQIGIGKIKLTKKQIGIVCGVIVVLVVALVATLVLVLNRNGAETIENTEATTTTQEIDYGQKITDEDGGEFKAEYQAGSEQSFAMRFSDLKCEDNCKNVSEVKLGDKVLKQGEDYEVKSGSIIIILAEDFMKSLKAGEFDLVIVVVGENKTMLYGVKFTVKPEPTCEDGEVLEKGQCVKESEKDADQGQTSNTGGTKPSNGQSTTKPSQSNQSTTSNKSQAQIACESKTGPIGYTRIFRPQPDNRYNLPDWNLYWSPVGDWWFSNGATNMVWVGGACHPHVKDVQGYGSYSALDTPEQLKQAHPDIYNMMTAHPNEDLIVWYWGNGSRTYEFAADTSYIFNY